MRVVGSALALLVVSLGSAGAALNTGGAGSAIQPVSFDRDIRPILSENCFTCHGPDPTQRQGGLRLDRKEDLFARAAAGAPVVPGKPAASRIWVRVNAADPAQRMPPHGSGKSLTPRQQELLRRWIAEGARWSQHWAFAPVRRPALPAVKNAAWVRNPIDRFVLARLEREDLSPSPEADRVTLLRRLSLDLIGLPPTPEEIDAFVADGRSDAYEKQVERLLASPHYGERWGRHWLDAARYADSDGFEKDKQRSVWFYRDWVINAFNRDLPYNQFIIEQIAGDLLPNPTQDQIVATGFLRNSMINEEGGIDPEQFRMEAMFDRMDAVGKSVLGLTIQCAQCHTHKYDPLTHTEYYRMFAFLNNSDEGSIAAYTPEGERQRAEIFRKVREIEERLQHERPDWPQRLSAWEAQAGAAQPEWRIVRPQLDTSGGQKHILQEDGSILAQGYAPTKHTTEFTVRIEGDQPVTAVRLELLNDPNLPRNGPGRSIFGLSALTEFRLDAAPADQPGARQPVKIASGTADVNPAEKELEPNFDDRSKRRRVTGPLSYALDGKDETAWGQDIGPGRSNVPRQAIFVLEKPLSYPAGTLLTFRLTQNHGGWNSDDNQNNNLGRFRFSVTSGEKPAPADALPAFLHEVLAVPSARRTAAQTRALFGHWRTTVPEWKEQNAAIEQLWRDHPQPASQLVLHERKAPRRTHLLNRGDFLKPAAAVQPGVPAFLHPLTVAGGGAPSRLDFARWLVDPKSPTTSRSIVNRVWQSYFGTGIVRTSEDLGLQSDAPSHPELLDYLASVFSSRSSAGKPATVANARRAERGRGRAGTLVTAAASGSGGSGSATPTHSYTHAPIQGLGWSLKSLHRLIVTSATYRQASVARPELALRDPENRLLARGARMRVEGEIVRDIALAASGLLNPKVGGPSVFPPAPEFLFLPPTSYGPKHWTLSTGPDRYRRALYTFRYRSVPYPALQNFDTPNGDQSCVRRVRSNTPLQALTTLNEPLFLEAARALALKTVREGGATTEDRLTYAFRRCVGRRPTVEEAGVLKALWVQQATRFQEGKADPMMLIGEGTAAPAPMPPNVSAAELAAWTAVSRVLLNLDETITRE